MFRFTIRDVLWLMVVVGMGVAWGADRRQQNVKMKALEEIAHLDAHEFFPSDWDGKVGAFRNQIAILKDRVAKLTRELESRGHRVEIDDCGKIVVDRPRSLLAMPPAFNDPLPNFAFPIQPQPPTATTAPLPPDDDQN